MFELLIDFLAGLLPKRWQFGCTMVLIALFIGLFVALTVMG